ncbi:MAG: hypothetical protein IMF14_07155 [Proteobacteria bacterium]|nr:hypothetical protein [Pseudomonadota bacterium]
MRSFMFLAALLLPALLLPTLAQAENSTSQQEEKTALPSAITLHGDSTEHSIIILYSPGSKLQQTIYEKLVKSLTHISSNIHLSTITDDTEYVPENYQPELVVTLGANNIDAANRHFPKTEKLLIISNPGKYDADRKNNIDSNNTLLYMTQPYCRQIRFIQLINHRWKTISYISGEQNPVDEDTIRRCANKFGMSTHKVWASDNAHLSHDIKDALHHSDLLLALPDRTIYNSKTVKNILLTSYRIRKPVIAFSINFVNAGAIAAIYSDIQQISQSASTLIWQYFSNAHAFNKKINYPETFDISFNRQVFKALGLDIPDPEDIKNKLTSTGNLENSSPPKQTMVQPTGPVNVQVNNEAQEDTR